MSKADLRFIFGGNDRSISSQEAFTDRESQWRAVSDALSGHAQLLRGSGFDVEDLEAPRRNVLVFHGVGGIGKSTLSRKIEAALSAGETRPSHWSPLPGPVGRMLPVRIDLSRGSGTDFEQIVLSLRLAVAALKRPMPAFDLALRRYWDHNHPGESVEEYLHRGGALRRFGSVTEFPDQMRSTLADLAQALALPGTVGGALGQGAKILVQALREKRQAVRALAGCSRLADVLEAEPDLDALSFMPHLLAWDLTQLPAERRATPVIMFDTFEDIGDRTHRELERLLQRVVWLMPNAFFVITGRNRLQWDDHALEGQLDWVGRHAWPELARSGAQTSASSRSPYRQFLIGYFSPEDCDDYLVRRLTRDGRPLINTEIRRAIVDRSEGLPLYLDLSAMRFLELRRQGRVPEPEQFERDFPALIANTVRDLTPQERTVLRSVSLLDSFSVPLAIAASGLDHEAPVQRLLERAFVDNDSAALWPYRLHNLVRSAVRSPDDTTEDRWSPEDWRRAALRCFLALGKLRQEHHPVDRRLLLSCLQQGLVLARDFDLELGWLVEAAFQYVDDSVWEPLSFGNTATTESGSAQLASPAEALLETLNAVARRQREHREQTVRRLTAVLNTRLLPDEAWELAQYYLAKAERDIGRADESRAGMRRIHSAGGRLAPSAGRGLAHLSRRHGKLPEALAIAQTLGWAGRQHRIEGDIRWLHGDMLGSRDAYMEGRRQAEQHRSSGESAMAQACVAFATAFVDPGTATDDIELANQLLQGVNLRWSQFNARLASLIADAGVHDDVPDRSGVLLAETEAAGMHHGYMYVHLVLCFHHAVRGDDDRLRAAISRLVDSPLPGQYPQFIEIAHFMAALPLPQDLRRTHWLEEREDDVPEQVARRWRDLVLARQCLLS
ncbi:ATP/GTP-binding protein [Streptomyces sp. NPDC002599]|uniref:ATP/GTP-binding protein n=1 Tax=Streptomyces sp. NPDC002599 TaxID=3154421 RepID=UPI00331B3D58